MTIWRAMWQALLLMFVASVLAWAVIMTIKGLDEHPVITTIVLAVIMFVLLTVTIYFHGGAA